MMRSAILVLALGATVSLAYAQFETSEVLGTVRDPSRSVVVKATVTLTNQETGIVTGTETDGNGNYDFLNVKVGRYTVTVEHAGFSKFTTTDLAVDVTARQRVDANLAVGQVTDSVAVTAAGAVLETDSSDHSQVINTEQIRELPLNGRDYANLALLATNVHISPQALSFAPNATPREGAFNVNGMRSTYNNFLMDGLDNNSYGTSNQGYSSQVVQPSPDAIAEFKMTTSNFSAEYGRVGGGVVNAALRSGTNEFHGTAYEFLRNTDLNAIGYIFGQRPATFQKPTLHRNQFGLTIGGPIIRNKLFFFGDYEGFRSSLGFLNFYTLPDAAERQGILPVPVVNPLTGAFYAANTQIPIAQLNPFAAAGLAGLAPATTAGLVGNNLEETVPVRDKSDKYDAKLDYQVKDGMTAFLRFSQKKDIQFFGPFDPGPSGGDSNGFIHSIQQQAAIGYTWAVTSSSLLEARFGFDHGLGGKEPVYLGGPSLQSLYGIQGLPTTPNITGGFNTQVIGSFSSPTIGRQSTNPQFQNPTSFNPKLNYSTIRGRHSLKMGYEFLAIRTEVLDINPLYGQLTYSGQFSKPTAAQCGCTPTTDANSVNAYDLADFYFGLPSAIALGNDLVTNLRQHVHSLYLQDDWRVTPKLTLNLGLRWEFSTPLWERDNQWSNFNPATNSLVRATSGSLYNRSLVNPDYKDYGPRLGLAYSVAPKTVIRGGYGISYTFFNRAGSATEGINGPLAIFGTITQSNPTSSTFLTAQNAFTTGIASNFNPVNSNNEYIPANTRWPYIQSWFFSVQREIDKDTVVDLSYNGNHDLRLPIVGDWNQAAPNQPGGTLSVQARRPDQSFGPITWLDPVGNNNYNGLSARFEHRLGHGLYLLNSFTWSHAMGDSEQVLEAFSGYQAANPQNIHDLAAEFGPTMFDVKLLNVTSVVYDLPFGKGRQFAKSLNPVLDAILGGWELNTINTANTGLPVNVDYNPPAANDVTGISQSADYRGVALLRPNVSGSPASQSTAQSLLTYFAGYSFTTPPASAPFGDLGRNAFRAPGFTQWDLGVDKDFRIREGMKLQFRSEFFNFLNHTNFGVPNNVSTSGAFGTITTTYPPRQIQFALKLMF
jgi:hypothetical protein